MPTTDKPAPDATQVLDAQAIERATGIRAGRVYWRSKHDHLYALELADLGRGRPSMAMVYGHWDRYEPRPPEHEIDADLMAFLLWVAEIAPSLDPADVATLERIAVRQDVSLSWVIRQAIRQFADREPLATGSKPEGSDAGPSR